MTRVAIIIGILLLSGIVGLLVIRNWPEKGPAVGQVTGDPVAGDEVVLLVSGWSEAELETILSDFREMYDLRADSIRVIASDRAPAQIEISGPSGPTCWHTWSNYLHYPKDMKLDDRRVAAIAVVQRSRDSLGGPSELAGRRATIYVPADDTEFDEVFVRIDPASYFRISFTRLQWRSVEDGREPGAMQDLVRNVADELEGSRRAQELRSGKVATLKETLHA